MSRDRDWLWLQPRVGFRRINNSPPNLQQIMIPTVIYPATVQQLVPPPAVISKSRSLAEDTVISVAAVRRISVLAALNNNFVTKNVSTILTANVQMRPATCRVRRNNVSHRHNLQTIVQKHIQTNSTDMFWMTSLVSGYTKDAKLPCCDIATSRNGAQCETPHAQTTATCQITQQAQSCQRT